MHACLMIFIQDNDDPNPELGGGGGEYFLSAKTLISQLFLQCFLIGPVAIFSKSLTSIGWVTCRNQSNYSEKK